jgi:hypothetical protein
MSPTAGTAMLLRPLVFFRCHSISAQPFASRVLVSIN